MPRDLLPFNSSLLVINRIGLIFCYGDIHTLLELLSSKQIKHHIVFTFIVVTTLLLTTALFIRHSEKPYYLYYEQQYLEADPGLNLLAKSGDGFAAFLMGKSRGWQRNQDMVLDPEGALEKYKEGADLLNIEAASSYIVYYTILRDPDDEDCRILHDLLVLGAQTGNLRATYLAGFFHEIGANTMLENRIGCLGYRNSAKALYYYWLASQIDHRMVSQSERVTEKLTVAERSQAQKLLNNPIKPITQAEYFDHFKSVRMLPK